MIVLAIDTAGADCAAALYDSTSGAVLGECVETIGRGHAERLMAVIDKALEAAARPISVVERVAVVIGPGSFTGIRVGVAAARGLALALGVKAVGVTTLSVIAAQAIRRRVGERGTPVIAAMDARRDELYLQAFSASGDPLSAAMIVSLEEGRGIAADHPDAELVGSGAGLLVADETARPADCFCIAVVAALGVYSVELPKPLYLRGPDVRPQQGFAVARR